MTRDIVRRNDGKAWRDEIIAIIILCATLLFGLLISSEGAEFVRSGMLLAVSCVIPSSFPFMIISDVYAAYGRAEKLHHLGRVFSRVLGIPPSALGAFICGNVGGFPLGAKMCADAYRENRLSESDAERLIPLSNNPSCAFIIGGVGIGMWGDVRVGFLLLFSVLSATLICCFITRGKYTNFDYTNNNTEQNYNFVESVKRAGINCIGIISFISLFCVVCGILKKRVKNALILYPFYSILEVTNAVSVISKSVDLPPALRLSLCAFSLGFGGVCVGMQSAVFVSGANLKMRKYYRIKLLEGVLSASISTLLYHI